MAKIHRKRARKTRTAPPTKKQHNPRTKATISEQLERPDTNSRLSVVVVPGVIGTDQTSVLAMTPKGSPGRYRTSFVLCIPGQNSFLDHLDMTQIMQSGDSLLQASADYEMTLRNENGPWTVHFTRNAKGRVSTFWVEYEAQSFAEAEQWSYNQVAPILSYWSYYYNLPIDILGYEILEEQTKSRKWVFGVLGNSRSFDLKKGTLPGIEYRRLLAAYREAMSSTNVFYQVLSFYKVIEGIRTLRIKRREQAKAKGEVLRNPTEQIPADLDSLSINNKFVLEQFRPYLGKKFSVVIDQSSRIIRNAIAHLDPTGQDDVLDADNFADIQTCEKIIPVLHFIARQMLSNEIEASATVGTQ